MFHPDPKNTELVGCTGVNHSEGTYSIILVGTPIQSPQELCQNYVIIRRLILFQIRWVTIMAHLASDVLGNEWNPPNRGLLVLSLGWLKTQDGKTRNDWKAKLENASCIFRPAFSSSAFHRPPIVHPQLFLRHWLIGWYLPALSAQLGYTLPVSDWITVCHKVSTICYKVGRSYGPPLQHTEIVTALNLRSPACGSRAKNPLLCSNHKQIVHICAWPWVTINNLKKNNITQSKRTWTCTN